MESTVELRPAWYQEPLHPGTSSTWYQVAIGVILVPVTVTPLRPDAHDVRRQELAAFLRSRRERLTPEAVGLTTYGRRRTPGLRREEVAQLAGVGVTWYTWLEQGRDINVSTQVLEALARTLQFDRHEHAHLLALAGVPDAAPLDRCPTITPGVLTVLEQLDPSPAVVHNARRDILAFNEAYTRVFPDIVDVPPEDRNLLVLCFTHPGWRRRLPDWEEGARRLVAQFRGAMAEHVAEAPWKRLLERLLAESPEFATHWERHEVLGPETGCKRFDSEHVGRLRLDFTHLWLDQRLGTRMTVYTAADEATRTALETLRDLYAGAERPAGVAQR
jgi:transcriptional regulator with XRE-family HTH domain